MDSLLHKAGFGTGWLTGLAYGAIYILVLFNNFRNHQKTRLEFSEYNSKLALIFPNIDVS